MKSIFFIKLVSLQEFMVHMYFVVKIYCFKYANAGVSNSNHTCAKQF